MDKFVFKQKLKRLPYLFIGMCVFLVLAGVTLILSISNSGQSTPASVAKVTFEGEYKIGDGEWLPIVKGEHITSSKGDVTLKGYFQFYNPKTGELDGKNYQTDLAFFFNHIGCTILTSDGENMEFEVENDKIGASSCGEMVLRYSFWGNEDTIVTIVLSNPHGFGNEKAVDEFLSSIAVYGGMEYERAELNKGYLDRIIGFIYIVAAFIILGVACFSVLLHVKYKKEMFLAGFMILFGGVYHLFSAHAVYFWNQYVAFNTAALQLSAMLFVLFFTATNSYLLTDKLNSVRILPIAVSFIASITSVLVSLLGKYYIYDTWLLYLSIQSVSIIASMVFSAIDIKNCRRSGRIMRYASIIFLTSFLLDFITTAGGGWQGAFLTKISFAIIFAIALFSFLRIIPQSINAGIKAQEIESEKRKLVLELQKSRVSLMLSQIKPHFIYNTLGTIGELCEDEPQKAKQLVQDFSLYLRGNFEELDNTYPIPVMQEVEHVKHYAKIENVRFPDMVITFDLEVKDFFIPALSLQPLVENAIKHGLLKLEKGGVVTIKSYETSDAYCISVVDNGVGFDTSKPIDEKKHIGIRNIRDRLKLMCGGTLKIDSVVGVGTTAIITIPKEWNNEGDNR